MRSRLDDCRSERSTANTIIFESSGSAHLDSDRISTDKVGDGLEAQGFAVG